MKLGWSNVSAQIHTEVVLADVSKAHWTPEVGPSQIDIF